MSGVSETVNGEESGALPRTSELALQNIASSSMAAGDHNNDSSTSQNVPKKADSDPDFHEETQTDVLPSTIAVNGTTRVSKP
jgi:hypothetical protein